MNLKDFTRLKGLMAMTGSDNDHEALQAIRAANRILFTNGLTWDMVFGRTVKVIEEVEPVISNDDDELERAFDLAMRSSSGSFLRTVHDIYDKWKIYGQLTPNQRRVIEDAAERAAERHPGGRLR